MNRIKYFFECYFNQSYYFDELDKLVDEYKKIESNESKLQFITELHQIIQTKSYALAAKLMKKYASKDLDPELTEKVIKFMFNRLTDQPAHLDMKDFKKDCKVVFCPVCCPDPEKIKSINLIEKATITKTSQQIYICKPCKLVWLTEDIRNDNAQDYKKFMKTLGLKGLWKELRDIDTL